MSNERITAERFKKRLADLCVGSGPGGLPRRPADREILFTSVLLTLRREEGYTQKTLDRELVRWLTSIAEPIETDHVTLRREMVDRGFLVRESDGSQYRAAIPDWWTSAFESGVLEVDVPEVVERARQERARRKQAHARGPAPKGR